MTMTDPASSRWRIVLVCVSLSVLAALLFYISHRDASSRILQVERLMVAEARAISAIIAESSTHGLETYGRWENELNRRLVDNARWIADHDSRHGTDAATLALFAREHGLHRILVFDAQGKALETIPCRFGFREIESRDQRLWVNGVAVLLKGVNRHEHHPDFGRGMPLETMVRDVELMKRFNSAFNVVK